MNFVQEKEAAQKKKSYKKGIEHDETRRRRTETTVQIRKEKRDDQLQKRRSVLDFGCASYFLIHNIIIKLNIF
jgi:hypothetical protein